MLVNRKAGWPHPRALVLRRTMAVTPLLVRPRALCSGAAYLRHRLRAARKWFSMHPELDRLEAAGQDVPAPRLGRTGIGAVGARSAHPITPFRVSGPAVITGVKAVTALIAVMQQWSHYGRAFMCQGAPARHA